MTTPEAAAPLAANKPTRKELRLQIAAQLVASNYDAVLEDQGENALAARLERVLRVADSLIDANDQFQARIFAARKAAPQGHEKGNG